MRAFEVFRSDPSEDTRLCRSYNFFDTAIVGAMAPWPPLCTSVYTGLYAIRNRHCTVPAAIYTTTQECE